MLQNVTLFNSKEVYSLMFSEDFILFHHLSERSLSLTSNEIIILLLTFLFSFIIRIVILIKEISE